MLKLYFFSSKNKKKRLEKLFLLWVRKSHQNFFFLHVKKKLYGQNNTLQKQFMANE